MKMPRELIACALWVAATLVMTFGSADSHFEGHNSVFLAWGIFLAVAACVPTGCAVIRREAERREQMTVEHIVEVVDALRDGQREVSHLH